MFLALYPVVFLLPKDVLEVLLLRSVGLRGAQQTVLEAVLRLLVNLAHKDIVVITRGQRIGTGQREFLLRGGKAQGGTTVGIERIELSQRDVVDGGKTS